MQEGTLALMQLAKTVAALERLRAAGVPYVSIMTDPTTGGVFASFASLGDVNLAEPNALIGFAGARVSAGTIGQELPDGFQRAEFLFRHGFVDRVVHRSALRAELAAILRFLVPVPAAGAPAAEEPLIPLPSFRPLAVLSAIAEKVIPPAEPGSNGRTGEGAGGGTGASGGGGTTTEPDPGEGHSPGTGPSAGARPGTGGAATPPSGGPEEERGG